MVTFKCDHCTHSQEMESETLPAGWNRVHSKLVCNRHKIQVVGSDVGEQSVSDETTEDILT